MNSIIVSAIPDNGTLEIFLGTKWNGQVGLVDILLPPTTRKTTLMSVSCDQVDSTCFNRKRLLRTIYIESSDHHSYRQFKEILYYKLDSSDYKLIIRLFDETGPIEFKTAEPVMVTLNLEHDPAKRWINM